MRTGLIAAGLWAALMPAAHAEGVVTCTPAPRDQWIAEAEMKSRIAALGYKVQVFKVTRGGCYEIYGRDAAGKRVEVYFDPVDGKIVKQRS
jgi:hypothetical protein